jgi:hypothetical protein
LAQGANTEQKHNANFNHSSQQLSRSKLHMSVKVIAVTTFKKKYAPSIQKKKQLKHLIEKRTVDAWTIYRLTCFMM